MPLTRDQAQQRADDIQAFRREAQRLQAEHPWPLDDAPLAQIAAHHEQLLAQYRAGFDIDPDQQSKRLSLSMRIVSLLGALALAASLLFFFYQFWGLFGEATQVGILLGFSLGSLLLTFALRRRDPSGYFAKLAAKTFKVTEGRIGVKTHDDNGEEQRRIYSILILERP